MRRYQEEHQRRRRHSGPVLTLRSESVGSKQDRWKDAEGEKSGEQKIRERVGNPGKKKEEREIDKQKNKLNEYNTKHIIESEVRKKLLKSRITNKY